jgi:hypothetical protein
MRTGERKMRKITKFLAAAAAAMVVGVLPQAQAGLISGPLPLRGAVQYIKFDTPTLAPMAFTMFCMRYAAQGIRDARGVSACP